MPHLPGVNHVGYELLLGTTGQPPYPVAATATKQGL